MKITLLVDNADVVDLQESIKKLNVDLEKFYEYVKKKRSAD